MIAVSPEVKGYQIGTHIFAHNLQLAKILNFKEVILGKFSQNYFDNLL